MFQFAHSEQSDLRQAITNAYRRDELEAVQDMLQRAKMTAEEQSAATELARKLVTQVRANRTKANGVDALMHEFALSSEEGIALMCLAEALLRIPDADTRDKLIQDKLSGGNWKKHLGNSPSLFVNAAAWGLLITGKLTQPTDAQLSGSLNSVLAKGGAPLIRKGMDYGMRMMGKQFVTGQTIEEALANGKEREKMGYRYSFDMLGEAAMTAEDAERYYQDYVNAIHAIGKDAAGKGVYDGNGISVKLSAIHPRYSRAQYSRVMTELLPRLKQLFLLGKQYDIGINIDAEEANRMELSLDLVAALVADPDLAGYTGIGLVVQAYQKRCPFIIDYLIDLARKHNQRLMVRLVKGAYWDSEIKWAQVDGLDGYPVYTRKVHTDISYLACARKLLSAQDAIFPQFATHNAYTLAAIYNMGKGKDFEHQCLHGMGETLYDLVVGEQNLGRRCRVYAPVGTHETLLAYLVRRLLENGANTSFVNQIVDENISIDDLIRSPFDTLAQDGICLNSGVPLPEKLYGDARQNSRGVDFSNENVLQDLEKKLNAAVQQTYAATSLVNGLDISGSLKTENVHNPANHSDIVGTVAFADAATATQAIDVALTAAEKWRNTPAVERASCLKKIADLYEENAATLMMLAVREAGKTLNNAVAEVREAVDFCRYYAAEAVNTLPENTKGRGVMVAISPWNFPLAIFTGEVVAALASGNTVVAKPAEQTSLIAHFAVKLMHQAGVPTDALNLILGAGDVGATLTQDMRISGVIFTGSTEVARLINQTLAKRDDNPVLIAETGGQNAMIVDSSALPEQVVADVLNSAFDSAGQRCSALRVLCVQEEVADRLIGMIKGAMNELCVGNPCELATDVGAVIDAEAQSNLLKHIEKMKLVAQSFNEIRLPENAENGTFVAPILFELTNLDELTHEVFGPVLHVIRYHSKDLEKVLGQINSKGYALTHGVHSRIDSTVECICHHVQAGNIYVNRNIVGAVVGVQPFGGHGLSGTGPKAGGSFYLQRLSSLKTWVAPKTCHLGQADEKALNLLQSVLAKLPLSADEIRYLAEKLGVARVYTLHQAYSVLPSCTGERNVISWHSPKQVGLFGGSLVASVAAVIELAAAGVQTVVGENHVLAEWVADLGDWVRVVSDLSAEADLASVILLAPMLPEIKQALANRDGALVRLIDAQDGLDMLQVYQEVSCSINTSAAGGDANLMARGDR